MSMSPLMDEAEIERQANVFIAALRHGKGPDKFLWSHKQSNYRRAYTYETDIARQREEHAESLRVRRDPCGFCGVRADIGCEHSAKSEQPLSMAEYKRVKAMEAIPSEIEAARARLEELQREAERFGIK